MKRYYFGGVCPYCGYSLSFDGWDTYRCNNPDCTFEHSIDE